MENPNKQIAIKNINAKLIQIPLCGIDSLETQSLLCNAFFSLKMITMFCYLMNQFLLFAISINIRIQEHSRLTRLFAVNMLNFNLLAKDILLTIVDAEVGSFPPMVDSFHRLMITNIANTVQNKPTFGKQRIFFSFPSSLF